MVGSEIVHIVLQVEVAHSTAGGMSLSFISFLLLVPEHTPEAELVLGLADGFLPASYRVPERELVAHLAAQSGLLAWNRTIPTADDFSLPP